MSGTNGRLTVAGLWLYPLKGGAGIQVDRWPLDSFGLRYDRRWMVVDETGTFLSQRSDPALGQVRPDIDDTSLIIRSPAAGDLRLPLDQSNAPLHDRTRARIWLDDVDVLDCGDEAADFMSTHLGRSVRIVHMPDDSVRQVDLQYSRAGDRVSFVDGFPLLLIGEASLEELNRRLDEPVEMKRFRPNIVVRGGVPHAEDEWRSVRVGSVLCDVVKPCGRCVVTTIDPATSVAGREPLRTLGRYRRRNGNVLFGQNIIHRSLGVLAAGDSLDVLDTRDPVPDTAALPDNEVIDRPEMERLQ